MNNLTFSFFASLMFLYCYLNKTEQADQDSVKVSLYYESLCPYSQEFVVLELYPAYLKLQDAIVVDLVPFGKANQTLVDGQWEFKCQHGSDECLGNKIQACVLSGNYVLDQKISFVNCVMNSSDPSSFTNGETCAQENNINWETEIKPCAEGTDGDTILTFYGNRTKALIPKLTYVPHILFNGAFNETLEDDARTDLVKVVCSLLDVKPSVCN